MHRIVGLIVFIHLFFLPQAQLSRVELEVRPVPKPVLRDTIVDQWNQSFAIYHTLIPELQDLLYWTNYSRIQPKRFWDSAVTPILNQFQDLKGVESRSLELDLLAAKPLPLFKLNEALVKTAQDHCDDMAINNAEPSHTSTNGRTFQERMRLVQIKNCANENLSVGSHNVLISLVLLYLDIRLPEKGHRKTLLNPNLTEIGIGYAMYNKDQFFMVQDFACTQN